MITCGRRVVAVVLLMTMAAAACGSSDAARDEGTDTSGIISTTPTADAEVTTGATSSPAAPLPAAGGAAAGTDAEPVVTPHEAVRNLARSVFNVDPDEASIACVISASTTDAVLADALATPAVAFGQFDDVQLKAIAFAMNGCLDPLGLAGWATEAVGPAAEVRDSATPCFAERFGHPTRGDTTFYTFVAVTLQYRVEPDGVPDVTEALATCTPVSSLASFFAGRAEADSGYLTEVDRDCLSAAIAGYETSESFWSTLIEGLVSPSTVIDPYVPECSTTVDADLAAAIPADFEPWSASGVLATVSPTVRDSAYDAPPPMKIDPAKSYEAVLTTGGAEIRIRLFADQAPLAVNNFVNLARDGFFDRTTFHRVLAGFMAQGGDPTGTGLGGPGYTFADEFDNGAAIDSAGLLAMANSGPDTNGSQFFITLAPAEWLTGKHTVFGEVIEGQDVVDEIMLRDPDAPNGRGQVLESVRIIES